MKKVYMVMENDVRKGRDNEVIMVFNNADEACKYANQRTDEKEENLKRAYDFEIDAETVMIKRRDNRIYVYDYNMTDDNIVGGGLEYNCWVKDMEVYSKYRK